VPEGGQFRSARILIAGAVCLAGLLLTSPASAAPLTWSAPQAVDPGHPILALSCPSQSLCVGAVGGTGDIVTSTNPTGGSGAWAVTHISGAFGIGTVSCASASLCVALTTNGHVISSTNPTGGVAAWELGDELSPGVSNESIACPSTLLCVATVGQQILEKGLNHPDLFTSINPITSGSWGSTVLNDEPEHTIRGVSCASPVLCVGVGDGGHAVTSTNPNGGAGAWTAADIDGTNNLYGVSCTSASLCVAGDIAGNVALSTSPTGGSGAWSTAHIDGGFTIFNVSCASAPLCAAVDDQGNVALSSNPTGGPSAWTVSKIDQSNEMKAISCPSATLCVAGDELGNVIVGTGEGGQPGEKGGGGAGSSGGGGGGGEGQPPGPTAGLADQTPSARVGQKLLLSAAGSQIPAGQSVSSYQYQLGPGGETSVKCPGFDPVLQVTATQAAATVASVTVTTNLGLKSTAAIPVTLGSPLTLPVLKVSPGAKLPAHGASLIAPSLGALGIVASECVPRGGAGGGGSTSRRLVSSIPLRTLAPTYNAQPEGCNGGPPVDVKVGIIDGLGCWQEVDAGHPLKAAEAALLCSHEKASSLRGVGGCRLSSQVNHLVGLAGLARVHKAAAGASLISPSNALALRYDQIWYSTQPVGIDGLEIDPVNGGEIVLARAGVESSSFPKADSAYLLSSDAVVRVGGLPISLHVPDYSKLYAQGKSAAGCAENVAGGVQSGELSNADCLGSLGVPSLTEVENAFKLPNIHGPIDLSVSPHDLGIELGSFEIPKNVLPLPVLPSLPLSGKIQVNLTGLESATAAIHVELPILEDGSGHRLTGDTTLSLDNVRGLQIDNLDIKVPSLAQLGLARLRELEFHYKSPSYYAGMGTIDLNDLIHGLVRIHVLFERGNFQEGDVLYYGEAGGGFPVFGPVYLTRLSAGLSVNPVHIHGDAQLSVGPSVTNNGCGALGIHGTADLVFGNPVTLDTTAEGSILCADLGPSKIVHADSNGNFSYVEHVNYTIPNFASVDGDEGGAAYLNTNTGEIDFQIDGKVVASGGIQECVGAEPFESCVGAGFRVGADATLAIGLHHGHLVGGTGLCVHLSTPIGGFDVGAGINDLPGALAAYGTLNYPQLISHMQILLSNCNVSQWRLLPPGAGFARSHVGGARVAAFAVPAAEKMLIVGIQGQGGAPQVLLKGPGGKRVQASLDGISTDNGALVVRQPATGQTLIEVPTGAAGTWSVQSLPGSPAVKFVETAHPLSPPRIKVSVSGHGARRVLRYRVTAQPGLSVGFLEGVDRGARPIGAARGTSGVIAFTPALGSTTPRTIIARIRRNGLAAPDIVVGRYSPGVIRAGRASHIAVRRTRAGWRITWTPGSLATEQLLTVRFIDGAQVLLLAKGSQRSLTLARSLDRHAQPTAIEILARRGQSPGPPAFAVARRAKNHLRH